MDMVIFFFLPFLPQKQREMMAKTTLSLEYGLLGGHLNAYRFENTINFRNNAYNILDME